MDGNSKRLDFRRATICVPPSALNSHGTLSIDLSNIPFTSPLYHKYSPRTHFLIEEPQLERNISRSHSVNFPRERVFLDEKNPSTKFAHGSPFPKSDTSYSNENEVLNENKPRVRRLSSSNFESHKIFQSQNFPDTRSFEKRRKSISSSINPNDIENSNLLLNQSTYQNASFGSMDHHQQNHEYSDKIKPAIETLDFKKRSHSISVPTSPNSLKSSSKFTFPPISSPSVEKPYFFSQISRKIFGSSSVDEPNSAGYASHEKGNSFTSSQPNLSRQESSSLFSFDHSASKVPVDNSQRESPISGSRPTSPRPISPFGSLLLRTEF